MGKSSLGSKRTRVVYQVPADAGVDTLGQDLEGWVTVGTYWAAVRSPSGREYMAAEASRATVSHAVETLWPGFTFDPRGRLVVEGSSPARVFNVVSCVDVDEQHRELLTMALEVVAPAPVS